MMKALKWKWSAFKYRMDTRRWKFWAWVMDKHPRAYDVCQKVAPSFTLPF